MPQPFHICFTFLGNIEFDSRILKCARTLSSNGYRVSALTLGEKSERRNYLDIEVMSVGISSRVSGKARFLLFYVKGLRPTLRARADCYFASDLYSLPLAYLAARVSRARLLYDSRELYTSIASLKDRRFTQRFWSFLEKKLIHSADAVFTVNDALSEYIAERYRMPKPVTLLNCPPKQVVAKSDRLRRQLSVPSHQKIILYQGGLQRGRGIFIALSVIKKIPNAVLVLLGHGGLKGEFSEIVQKENLQQRVFILDAAPVNELLTLTASADVGLCLIENLGKSYYHSLPNKLFEYASAGVPVVASNFPEISRFVESNRVGICVDPENEEEVAAAIQRLITDSKLYASLVDNCKQTAERYTWENQEPKLLAVMDRLRKQ